MVDTALDANPKSEARSAKDEVRALLDRLPDDLTLEQIQYHLAVIVKITRSEEQANRDGWLPHAEFERRLARWLE